MSATPDVLSKIKKLMDLAGKNQSEEESNSAMAAAQRLMAKYNLDMAQVESVDTAKLTTEGLDIKRLDEKHKRGAMYEYQQRLWATVASVNLCWYWTTPVYKGHRRVSNNHRLVGREANVLSAKMMGDYLEETINRLCPYKGKDCLSRSAISWKEGMASRLQARLHERFAELAEESRKAAEVDPQALTLVGVQDAEYNANYAFLYGQDKLKQMLMNRAAREQQRREEAAQAVVNASAVTPETDAQRKKREAKAARDQKRYERKQDKYWERRDVSAWYEGRSKADDVNLDSQVDQGTGDRTLE